MKGRNLILVLVSAFYSCASPIQRMSLDKPVSYDVVGPSIEGKHCVPYLVRFLPLGAKVAYPSFDKSVSNAIEQTFPHADGLIDAEFFIEDNGLFGMQCILVRGIPIRLNIVRQSSK